MPLPPSAFLSPTSFPFPYPCPQLFAQIDYRGIIILLIVAFFYFKKKLHPIKLILLSAGLGIVFYGLPEYLMEWGLLGAFVNAGI